MGEGSFKMYGKSHKHLIFGKIIKIRKKSEFECKYSIWVDKATPRCRKLISEISSAKNGLLLCK